MKRRKLPPLQGTNDPKIVRLLPDDKNRMLCYTQVPFKEKQKYRIFEPKIEFVSLTRLASHPLSTRRELLAIAANIKILNQWIDKTLLVHYLKYVTDHHFESEFKHNDLENIAKWVIQLYKDGKLRMNGKPRRIVFKPGYHLTIAEKRSIIGRYSGKRRSVSAQSIYDCIEVMQDNQAPIKVSDIARELDCTTRPIHRFTKELREYLRDINSEISLNRDIKRYEEAKAQLIRDKKAVTNLAIKKLCKLSGSRFKVVKHRLGGTK